MKQQNSIWPMWKQMWKQVWCNPSWRQLQLETLQVKENSTNLNFIHTFKPNKKNTPPTLNKPILAINLLPRFLSFPDFSRSGNGVEPQHESSAAQKPGRRRSCSSQVSERRRLQPRPRTARTRRRAATAAWQPSFLPVYVWVNEWVWGERKQSSLRWSTPSSVFWLRRRACATTCLHVTSSRKPPKDKPGWWSSG